MVRSWIRQALRASGVAILVPAAVVAAIALSVIGGGHSLGSLGEVLHGPAVPPAEAAGLRGLTPQSAGPRGRTPQSAGPRGRTPQSGAPPARPLANPPAPAPRRPSGHAPAPRRPAPRPPVPAQPAPAPAPPAAPKPHPVHDAGTQAAETLRPLPLAGPAAAGAVEAVVSLVDPA